MWSQTLSESNIPTAATIRNTEDNNKMSWINPAAGLNNDFVISLQWPGFPPLPK